MARGHARIHTTVWQNAEFCSLPAAAQRLYFLLLSQPDVSFCGVLPYTPKRWARCAPDTPPERIEADLQLLQHHRYIVLDEGTEELWIRSFVRHDGILESPNVVKAMWKDFATVLSDTVRKGFREGFPELFQNGSRKGSAKGMATPAPSTTPSPLAETFTEFWHVYPRHVGRKAAETAWERATKTTDASAILEAVPRHVEAWEHERPPRPERMIPYPATWLNGERWLDELPKITVPFDDVVNHHA